MRTALPSTLLKQVYARKAPWYDWQHACFTLRSDQQGRRMVVEHAVSEGDRVLDAGGGTGSTALLAAERVGPHGNVIVFDLSEAMLEVAKERAMSAGLADRMAFQEGDLLHLPWANDSFDAVLSTFSMCPLYDPALGALELYRTVRPGGRLGAAHSVEPVGRATRWLAQRAEALIWRFPSLSMGCRPVATLPALQDAGAEVIFSKTIGVPLWPFLVYVVRKPARAGSP